MHTHSLFMNILWLENLNVKKIKYSEILIIYYISIKFFHLFCQVRKTYKKQPELSYR